MASQGKRLCLHSQAIFEVLSFHDQKFLTKLQILCKKFYDKIIPISVKWVRNSELFANADIYIEDGGRIFRLSGNWDAEKK